MPFKPRKAVIVTPEIVNLKKALGVEVLDEQAYKSHRSGYLVTTKFFDLGSFTEEVEYLGTMFYGVLELWLNIGSGYWERISPYDVRINPTADTRCREESEEDGNEPF